MVRLSADSLYKSYTVPDGIVRAVRGVSLNVSAGETLAIVGESGCGKSTLARLLVGLEKPDSGLVKREQEIVPMVFQDSLSSFHPRRKVKSILIEPLMIKEGRWTYRPSDDARALRLAEQVGLSRDLLERFPHELSGGQRQRVNIGRALALRSDVIVLDEPVSALDVSIQAQILNLLKDLQASKGLALILITHDLGVVRFLAQRVMVLYLGQVVEAGATDSVLRSPLHPYTESLLLSEPAAMQGPPARVVAGEPPSPLEIPDGCCFASRCPKVIGGPSALVAGTSMCRMKIPELKSHPGPTEPGNRAVLRSVSCHVAEQTLERGHEPTPVL